jgi:acyl-coenzyme A thioesterase PaaI-like protein
MVAVSLAGALTGPGLGVGAVADADARGLRVAPRAAVPGQVVTIKAPRGARVRIGGRKARVVGRRRGRLRVVVPALRPGRAALAVRAGKQRLRGRLRVRHGFSGRVRPTLERGRTVSRSIGVEGGTVTAASAAGTTFALAIPPGAVAGPTTISLTPVKRIKGFPLRGPRFAVQLSPDGLALLEPATLTITLKRATRGKVAGFVYDGAGRNLGLTVARRSGRTIVLTVEHFSTAGSTHITGRDLIILLGRLAAKIVQGTLDLDDVHLFAVAWSVLFVGNTSLCTADPTCFFVFSGVNDELDEQAAQYGCMEGNVPRGSDAIAALRRALEIDADLRLFGNNRKAAAFADERLCLTTSLVADADPPAQNDALGATKLAITTVDRTRADSDADGTLNNCEWAVFVGGVAAQQGFARLEGQATGACESGLQKVLDDGVARCDQDRQDGLGRLGDGQKVALGVGLLTAEFQAAIENCKPKLFVTPPSATVEIGQAVPFSARTNEGDASFDWTASDGTIDGNGTFTAPAKPGTVTVTATTRRILSGSATVTVKCPAGQVEFDGECRTISVTIAPANPAIAPGTQQQFTATVHNATNQAVTWTSSAGSISASGRFTAPSQPGAITITARAKVDTTKTGTTTVTVRQPGVTVTARSSQVSSLDASARTHSSNLSCPPGGTVFDHDFLIRPSAAGLLGAWDSGTLSVEATAPPLFCSDSSVQAEATTTTRVQQDVQSADGDFEATFTATDTHTLKMSREGTLADNQSTTSVLSMLGVSIDVVGEPVQLSCSTTLSGDPRDPQPQEVEDQVFELGIATQAGDTVLLIEDTTAPTPVTLAPGRYSVIIENKTARRRNDQTADLSFSFVSAGECHRVG